MLTHEQGAGVEDLPARLGLGTLEGVDQLRHMRREQIGLALGEEGDDVGRKLTLAATSTGEVLDQGCERVFVVLDALQLLDLLGSEIMFYTVCHMFYLAFPFASHFFSVTEITSGAASPVSRRARRSSPPPRSAVSR